MALPALLILAPFYAYESRGEKLSYMSFSILYVTGRQTWVPTAVCYLVAAVTFYVIFVFYRNFATLRQIFMANPSSLVSFAHLRRVVDDFGSLQDARAYFNISTRAVIISSISADYGPEDLKRLLENAQIGPVESIQQIVSTDRLSQLMSTRDTYLRLLEEELLAFYERLRVASLKPESPEWRALSDGLSDAGRSEVLTKIYSLPRLPVAERSSLMLRLLTDSSFMAQYRKTSSKNGSNKDKLQYYYQRFLDTESDLKKALKTFNRFHDNELIRQEHPQGEAYDLPGPNDGYIEKTSLISLKKALRFGENLTDLRSTLWGSSYAAVVVFKTRRSATLCRQLLLSARLYSLKVSHVPMPDDLIWSNANMPRADRTQRELLGAVLFVTFNVFFVFITTSLSVATDLEVLKENIGIIKVILEDYPQMKSVIQGILAPLAFNISIFVAPYILGLFLQIQGIKSNSALQSTLMSNYSWFLFFQTSIIGVIFSSFFEIFNIYTDENFHGLLRKIQDRMPHASYFFANIIFQRAFIGLMLILIQPGSLFKKLAFNLFYPTSSKTPRKLQEFRNPTIIQPGIIFPEYIVFPFQITMAFLTITPLSVIPGVLFYALGSLVFKHQFVYSYSLPNESGGEYWRKLVGHLLWGLLMNQIFTVAQFAYDRHAIIPTLLMLLLIGFTAAYIPFLERSFGPICAHLPLTGEDRIRKRRITEDLVHKQTHLLQVLQPIETAPLVFARLDAEGDLVEGYELHDDPILTESVESLETERVVDEKAGIKIEKVGRPEVPLTVPIIHQSNVDEDRLYEVIPLPLGSGPSNATFDPFDVDYLTDRKYLKDPYGHPFMLHHTQTLLVPAKLPALLQALATGRRGVGRQVSLQEQTGESPIVMGESAVSEPPGSPQDNPYKYGQ